MEGSFPIPTPDYRDGVVAFNLGVGQPITQVVGESLFASFQLLGQRVGLPIVAPGSNFAAEPLVAKNPESPGTTDRIEHVWASINVKSVLVLLPAVESALNQGIKLLVLGLQDLVKVDGLAIGVVDHFYLGWLLGPKYRSASEEGLVVKGVLRDKWQNMPEHVLFPTIVADGSLQF